MFKDSVYLVTGGNSGLGKATIDLLLRDGAKVAVFDLNVDENISGENILNIRGNVTSEEHVQNAMNKIEMKFGKLNGVINCAGIFETVEFTSEKCILDTFRRVLDVNTTGTFNVVRLAVPLIAKNTLNANGEKGVIIMTASIAAYDLAYSEPGMAAYCASKAAIVGMTMSLARDAAPHGIRVVTLAPGAFRTPMLAHVPNLPSSFDCNVFPKRAGDPKEYAEFVKCVIQTPMLNATTVRLDAGFR